MTVDAIIDAVFRRIGQKRASDNERVSDADVLAAVNEAYVQWAIDTSCFVKSRTVATDVDVATYALDVDVHRVTGAWYGTDYTELYETNAVELDNAYTTTWRFADSGTPSAWLMDGELFRLYLPPDTADVDVTLRVIVVPSGVTGGIATFAIGTIASTSPAFGVAYHQALVEGAILRMALQLPTLPIAKELLAGAASEYRRWLSTYWYAKAPTGGV